MDPEGVGTSLDQSAREGSTRANEAGQNRGVERMLFLANGSGWAGLLGSRKAEGPSLRGQPMGRRGVARAAEPIGAPQDQVSGGSRGQRGERRGREQGRDDAERSGAGGPAGLTTDSLRMNGSNVANPNGSATPPAKSKEDQVVNGLDEKESNPFAEYMWMENEEDFNRQVEKELQEEEFLDRCFQEMLDEEEQDWFVPSRDLPAGLGQQLNGLSVSKDSHSCISDEILSKSTLNPDAKEFVPGVKY